MKRDNDRFSFEKVSAQFTQTLSRTLKQIEGESSDSPFLLLSVWGCFLKVPLTLNPKPQTLNPQTLILL